MDEVRIPIELGAVVVCDCDPAADFSLHKNVLGCHALDVLAQRSGRHTMQ